MNTKLVASMPHRHCLTEVIGVFNRDHDVHPFVTGIVTGSNAEGGMWYTGHYFTSLDAAMADLLERAMWKPYLCRTKLEK